jgi:hypothetical protein
MSAGRNRIIVIRRELPRTKSPGWAQSACRIEVTRILLFRVRFGRHRHCLLPLFTELIYAVSRLASCEPRSTIDPNGTDKSEQLVPYRGYHRGLLFLLASSFR